MLGFLGKAFGGCILPFFFFSFVEPSSAEKYLARRLFPNRCFAGSSGVEDGGWGSGGKEGRSGLGMGCVRCDLRGVCYNTFNAVVSKVINYELIFSWDPLQFFSRKWGFNRETVFNPVTKNQTMEGR